MSAESSSLAIHSARFLGSVPPLAGRGWQLYGQDGGQSIDLGDRSLFVFSDTLLTATVASTLTSPGASRESAAIPNHRGLRGYFLANCAGLSPSAGEAPLQQCLGGIRFFEKSDGWPREILVANAEERRQGLRFWPQHGVMVNGAVYLFYLGIQCTDAEKTWGFRCLGSGLARLDPESGHCERLRQRGEWCIWPVMADDFHLGAQVLPADGWLYVFASLRQGLDCTLRVARVRPEAIEDPQRYEFLTATAPSWSSRLTDALDLGPCASEFSVSFNPHLQRYLLSYVHPFDKVLTLRTAKLPWGPYSRPKIVGQVPHHAASDLVFLAFEHPQFAAENGRKIYLTYSQPSFTSNSLITVTLA